MHTEDQDQPQFFAPAGEMSDTALVLWEQNQRQTEKFKTRYLYLPFMASTVVSSFGEVKCGEIVAVEAPRGKVNIKALPEGAQVTKIVSPSTGVPSALAQGAATAPAPASDDPAVKALMQRLQFLEKQAEERDTTPRNIAVYLIETAPIIDTILEYHKSEGAIEITPLAGMDKVIFENNRINDVLFGPEGERPTVASTIRERMNSILTQAASSASKAGRVLGACADEILRSVDTCEAYCNEFIRERHLKIEDVNDSDPKRYSKRDLRALEFANIARLQDAKRATVDLQEQSMRAVPALFNMLAQQNERWEKLFERLCDRLDNLGPESKRGGSK